MNEIVSTVEEKKLASLAKEIETHKSVRETDIESGKPRDLNALTRLTTPDWFEREMVIQKRRTERKVHHPRPQGARAKPLRRDFRDNVRGYRYILPGCQQPRFTQWVDNTRHPYPTDDKGDRRRWARADKGEGFRPTLAGRQHQHLTYYRVPVLWGDYGICQGCLFNGHKHTANCRPNCELPYFILDSSVIVIPPSKGKRHRQPLTDRRKRHLSDKESGHEIDSGIISNRIADMLDKAERGPHGFSPEVKAEIAAAASSFVRTTRTGLVCSDPVTVTRVETVISEVYGIKQVLPVEELPYRARKPLPVNQYPDVTASEKSDQLRPLDKWLLIRAALHTAGDHTTCPDSCPGKRAAAVPRRPRQTFDSWEDAHAPYVQGYEVAS